MNNNSNPSLGQPGPDQPGPITRFLCSANKPIDELTLILLYRSACDRDISKAKTILQEKSDDQSMQQNSTFYIKLKF